MDGQISSISEKLDGYKVELNKKGEEESDIKKFKSEYGTEKEHDSEIRSHTKFGQKIKSTHDTNSRILNETMESYRAHYEDKIVELFE